MLYVYEINSKISSLIIYFGFGGGGGGCHLTFGQKHFPLADTFYLGVVLDYSHLLFR